MQFDGSSAVVLEWSIFLLTGVFLLSIAYFLSYCGTYNPREEQRNVLSNEGFKSLRANRNSGFIELQGGPPVANSASSPPTSPTPPIAPIPPASLATSALPPSSPMFSALIPSGNSNQIAGQYQANPMIGSAVLHPSHSPFQSTGTESDFSDSDEEELPREFSSGFVGLKKKNSEMPGSSKVYFEKKAADSFIAESTQLENIRKGSPKKKRKRKKKKKKTG